MKLTEGKLGLNMANLRLALCNWLLSKAMDEDDTLTDKEYNSIREAHDSIASARDAVERLTKPQRKVSAEAKESCYRESEDEEIVKLADEYYDKVLLKECDMEEKEAHHCRISYIHGAKAILERQKQKYSNWNEKDEKIRKALIRFHKSTIDIDGIKGDEIVSWLEKQGTSYTKRDVDDAYVEGMDFAKDELEKQGQKSAWSEEDMSKVQRICKYLNEAKKYYADITEVRECMDWLKYIENRIKGG